MKYRPEIDGLRAIAVLSVVAYHLSPTLAPGGFVGVDIFFVISGFLISSQIQIEAGQGRFSLRRFYKRRINRILPALFTMMAAALLAGWFILSPADLVVFAKSAMSAGLGLSNVYLWQICGNYFHARSAEIPLLHSWSLGVEEQFYALWPLAVLLLLKLKSSSRLLVLCLLALAGVAISQAGTAIFASASYFLLPTRFFELMIGAGLALNPPRPAPFSRLWFEAGAGVGFILIAGPLFLFNRSLSFPGFYALVPCLGTALLIWSGERSRLAHRLLTLRPLVFIGLISYSLYLWHWPIVSYLHYLNVSINPSRAILIASVSILLAWLSWAFVEVPMRRSGATMNFANVSKTRFAIPCVVLLGLLAAVSATKGFPRRFDSQVAMMEAMSSTRPEILRSGCHVPSALYATAPNALCRLGAPKAETDGILIGDSFANHFTGMIDTIAAAQGISIIDYTMEGCPPILGYNTGRGGLYGIACLNRNQIAYRQIAERHYKRVILAGNWPRSTDVAAPLARSIEYLEKSGAQVTLILANESIPAAASCPVRRLMYQSQIECDSVKVGPPDYLESIQRQFSQLRIIDPNSVICAKHRCSPTLDGILLYRDDDHLNDVGSRSIGRLLLARGLVL